MRRSVLLTLSTLGVLICLLGGTGLFAALTDSADVGPNHLDTAPLPGSADLTVAELNPDPENPGGYLCGTFQDNLVTAFFDSAFLMPGDQKTNQLCVQNTGSQTVSLVVTAVDLSDYDYACTGDEEAYGDTSCGPGGPDTTGELSSVIDVVFVQISCYTGEETSSPPSGSNLGDLVGNPLDIRAGGLESGSLACFDIRVTETNGPSGYPVADLQKAQSDTVTWTFRFTGQAVT